jgi:hypothetical protein
MHRMVRSVKEQARAKTADKESESGAGADKLACRGDHLKRVNKTPDTVGKESWAGELELTQYQAIT